MPGRLHEDRTEETLQVSRHFLWSWPVDAARPADEKRRYGPALATASHGRLATSEGRAVEVGIGPWDMLALVKGVWTRLLCLLTGANGRAPVSSHIRVRTLHQGITVSVEDQYGVDRCRSLRERAALPLRVRRISEPTPRLLAPVFDVYPSWIALTSYGMPGMGGPRCLTQWGWGRRRRRLTHLLILSYCSQRKEFATNI